MMSPTSARHPELSSPLRSRDPLISLVISMYGVEPYLPDFLSSLDSQDSGLGQVEILFIDDGSPDESARVAQSWLENSGVDGRVIIKENGGLSSARNLGIREARGSWLSFPDPDDRLDVDYLRQLMNVLSTAGEDIHAVAANIIYLYDDSGLVSDTHPLRAVFQDGPRVLDLREHPQSVKLQAASTFIRRERVARGGLEFDARVRPNFEDGAFLIRYHALADAPRLAVVPDARYYYRQRSDDSSLVASSWTKPEKYLDLPRFGWIETLRAVADAEGRAPVWAQYMVLYDLHWYFRADAKIHTPTRSLNSAVQTQFMDLVRETLAFIAPSTIARYALTNLRYQERISMLALRDGNLSLSTVHIWRVDRFRPLVQLKYFFTGPRPPEQFTTINGRVEPVYAKDRSVVYFGETVMHERILWLPNDEGLAMTLNSNPVDLLPYASPYPEPEEAPLAPALQILPPSARSKAAASRARFLGRVKLARARWRRLRTGQLKVMQRARGSFVKARASRGSWRREFQNAWVFMDRDTQAQDNAEHLYRWVRANRPEINAWFVLRPSSSDWKRLADEGFRLVAFGSLRHMALLRNADHLLSSHIDHYVVHPWNKRIYGREPWSYTFLQHGVTKDDISRWLTGKPIDMLVAAAPEELAAFTHDGTPYVLTDREVKLTGFPRHDALLAKSIDQADEKDLIIAMPTWREYLMGATSGRGNDRDLVEGFHASTYVTEWAAFLNDPELRAFATSHGLRLAFMPHPNLEAHIASFHLPSDVEVLTYQGADVQEVIARAAVLVTDYSSLAFEAAYIETPVTYFQFDSDEFFSLHPHRPGYFDYGANGFGPVAATATAAAASVIAQLDGNHEEAALYAERARRFFLQRDGRNCERTFNAVQAIQRTSLEEGV